MAYEVKNVKTFNGLEGQGFEASIYKDGQKIGTALDDAHGGPVNIRIDDPAEQKALTEFVKGLPPLNYMGHELTVTEDLYISELVEAFIHSKWLKKSCANKTLFRVKGDGEGEYRTVNAPYSAKVKDFITSKYGDSVEEIVNERFLEGANR